MNMEATESQFGGLSSGELLRLDEICDRYEQLVVAGQSSLDRIEQVLAENGDLNREALLHALLRIEFEYMARDCSISGPEEYLERFMESAATVRRAWNEHRRLEESQEYPIDAADSVGEVLFHLGRFEVKQKIIDGDWIRYRAFDPLLGREVSIYESADGPDSFAPMVFAGMSGRCFPRILESVVIDDRSMLVTPWIEYRPFSAEIRNPYPGAKSSAVLLEAVWQVALAIVELHSQGLGYPSLNVHTIRLQDDGSPLLEFPGYRDLVNETGKKFDPGKAEELPRLGILLREVCQGRELDLSVTLGGTNLNRIIQRTGLGEEDSFASIEDFAGELRQYLDGLQACNLENRQAQENDKGRSRFAQVLVGLGLGITFLAGWTTRGWIEPVKSEVNSDQGSGEIARMELSRGRIERLVDFVRKSGGDALLIDDSTGAVIQARNSKFQVTSSQKVIEIILAGAAISPSQFAILEGWPDLQRLDVEHLDVSDSILKDILCQSTRLRQLDAAHTLLTDDGLQIVAELKSLRSLNLGNNRRITGKTLGVLAGLPLQRLNLDGTSVNDDGLCSLGTKRLENLDSLLVRGTRVTGEGWIEHLDSISYLYVSDTGVTDKMVQRLRTNNPLQCIWIDGTAITDESCRYLANFPELKDVNLNNTQITDAGFLALAACKSLKHVYVSPLRVSPNAIAEFNRRLPDCNVVVVH